MELYLNESTPPLLSLNDCSYGDVVKGISGILLAIGEEDIIALNGNLPIFSKVVDIKGLDVDVSKVEKFEVCDFAKFTNDEYNKVKQFELLPKGTKFII